MLEIGKGDIFYISGNKCCIVDIMENDICYIMDGEDRIRFIDYDKFECISDFNIEM